MHRAGILLSLLPVMGSALGQAGGLDFGFALGGIWSPADLDSGFTFSVGVRQDGVIISGGGGRIVALKPDGSGLEPSFGGDGVVDDVAAFTYETIVQADDKVLVTGTPQQLGLPPSSFFVARYLQDGTLDSAFGAGGSLIRPGLPFAAEVLWRTSLVKQDGRIVLLGLYRPYSSQVWRLFLLQLNVDGSTDLDFGNAGFVRDSVQVGSMGALRAVEDDNGGLVVLGSLWGDGSQAGTCVLLRYDASGHLDASFGIGGRAHYTLPPHHVLMGLAIQSSGRIIVSGGRNYWGATQQASFYVMGSESNGSLDAAFGPGGMVPYSDPGVPGPWMEDMTLDHQDRILLAGLWEGQLVVARYSADGQLDSSWGGAGLVLTSYPHSSVFAAVDVQPDGKVLAAGGWKLPITTPYQHRHPLVIRYHGEPFIGVGEPSPDGTRLVCHPNPFATEMLISFTLERAGRVSLDLRDGAGRLVLPIIKNEVRASGTHRASIGSPSLASGSYTLTLITAQGRFSRHVVKQ